MIGDELIAIPRKSQIKIIWNVLPIDYNRGKEKDIKELISKKYNIPKKNIKVEPNFIRLGANGEQLELTSDVITNIQDPNFQIKLFKEYIEINNIENVDFNQILVIDGEINSEIDYDVYDKFRRYKIKWLEWSNFLSYGEGNRIDLDELSGLVLLNGEPINQSGKTTFAIDLIKFLLFGTTTKAKTLDKLFNRHLKSATEVLVKGCIEIDNEDYIIERVVSRAKKRSANSKAKQEIKYFKLINGSYDVNKPLADYDPKDLKNEGGEVTETNKIIKEAIGKEGDFDLIISATAKNLDDLIDTGDTEKGRLLSRWIGLLPLEEKEKIAKEKFNKKVNPTLLSNTYNIETLTTEIQEYRDSITNSEKYIQDYEKNKLEIENKILKLDNEKTKLLSKKNNINNEIMKLDIITLNNTIDKIVMGGKKCREDLEKCKNRISELKDINVNDEEVKQIRTEINSINEKLVEYRTLIPQLKKENEELSNSEFCPHCKRVYDNIQETIEHNKVQINKNKTKINEYTTNGIKLNENKKLLEEKIETIEENSKLIQERNKLEIQESKLKVDISKYGVSYKEKKQLLEEYNKNKNDIDINNKLDIEINNINIQLKVENDTRDKVVSYIETEKANIVSFNKNIEDRDKLIVKLIDEQKLIRSWKLYLDMVGKNGISKMVLRNTLPIINGELSRFLNDICDFSIEINITEKNDVIFNIIVDDEVGDLSTCSGYERTLAALALRTVLANISTMPKPNFITIDECLGRVGVENLEKIKDLYDKITEHYQFVLHICHNEEVKSWHNHILTVSKINNVSKLVSQF